MRTAKLLPQREVICQSLWYRDRKMTQPGAANPDRTLLQTIEALAEAAPEGPVVILVGEAAARAKAPQSISAASSAEEAPSLMKRSSQ